jgi:hypothetical protein
LSNAGWMHQKQPPAKTAILVVEGGEFWPRRSLTSASATLKSRAEARILFMIVDLRQSCRWFVSAFWACQHSAGLP